jgi:hypothetical protein
LTIATRNRAITGEELFKVENDLKKAQKAQADATWRVKNLDVADPERAGQVGDAERWSKDVSDLTARKEKLIGAQRTGIEAENAAKHQLDLARVDLQKAKLANLESRAEQTASHYTNLAMMGPGGRAAAENAYNIVKRTGVMNIDPTILAQARSFAPNAVQAMIEREFSGADVVNRNKNEDTVFGNLREQREAAQNQQKAKAEAEAEATAAVSERQANSLAGAITAGVDKLLQTVIDKVNAKFQDLDVALRANQIKRN